MNEPKHPIQPLVEDDHGIDRFKGNAIVRHLLDNGGITLNHLACMEFSQDDREQFAQLIEYSLCGFGDLSYVSDETYDRAAAQLATQVNVDAPDGKTVTLVTNAHERIEVKDVARIIIPEAHGDTATLRLNDDDSFTVRTDCGTSIEIEASNTFTVRRSAFTAKEVK